MSGDGAGTGCELDGQGIGVRVTVQAGFLSFPCCPDWLRGLISIQWVPGVVSPAVKRPGREADHSSAISAEVDLYIPSPLRLHGVVLNQGQLYLPEMC
jgi:hypothetical protein